MMLRCKMLSGWKTVILGVSVILLAILQMPAFSQLTGGCIFEANASQPDTCAFPPSIIAGIGVLMVFLRFITTSAIFKK